jgi:glycyl-tRNA synthetase
VTLPLAQAFARLLALKTRVVVADRLPSYSERTLDIEVWNEDKWMEVCSMSIRKDFLYQPLRKNKPVLCKVLEIATSVERLIYNIQLREEMSSRDIAVLV